MRTKLFLVICVLPLLLLGPSGVQAEQAPEGGKFIVRKVKNPAFHVNELFRAYENYYSPRIKELRERYDLEEVVAKETDEFKRILLLRHWIHSNIPIAEGQPTPIRGDAFAILDAAKQGHKFQCGQFSVVQHAVLNSFGYITRRLGVGPSLRIRGQDGHHGVNEVWVNKLNKWMAIDAKYDLHFEKDGIPLSALEIRDEVWRDGGKHIVSAFGIDRKPFVHKAEEWGIWVTPEVYRWCSWETNTNEFTSFPAVPTSTLVMYEDHIFLKNIWYRNGKPHWAYGTPYLVSTTRRDWIYWTPNVISSKVKVVDDIAQIFLQSITPNFKTYQIKKDDGEWRDCAESLELALQKRLNRFTFRTANLFGVTGPEHTVEIEWKK